MKTKPSKALVKGAHRTVPIPATIESVRGYPSKLVIFRIAASPYFWVRYYDSGRIFKRTTKTDDKPTALKAAIEFYESLLMRKSGGMSIGKNSRFEVCAREMLSLQANRIARGELSSTLNYNEEIRLRKYMLPFFRKHEVTDIDYFTIESYLNELAESDLKVATIKLHASLLRKVLRHAHRKALIKHLPAFPTLATEDSPRGYFNSEQYSRLHNKAKALIGEEQVQHDSAGYVLRRVKFTEELYNLILFMTNTFVRPTDIKVLKHSHITIVRKPNLYLRLEHPPTKKHNNPVVSMPAAVGVYERQLAYQTKRGYGDEKDYVFMPENKNRSYALVQLRRQFEFLLEKAGLKVDARGINRTFYSLRHTAIMFRLLNSDGLDMLTLAKNARTSVEMIERFYGQHLKSEMNVEKIQSHRSKKKPAKKKLAAQKPSTATKAKRKAN